MGFPVIPLTPNDGWEETKDPTDRFQIYDQYYNPGYVMRPTIWKVSSLNSRSRQYPSNGDTPIRYDGPSPSSSQDSQDSPGALSRSDTINLVRSTFDKAIQEMRQTRAGSEGAGDAVKIKVTLNLSEKKIVELPNELVDIFKADVET